MDTEEKKAFKKGEVIRDAEITDIGDKGKLIAKKDGFVILTDKAVPGDVADIFIYKKKSSFAEGNVVKITKESPLRTEHFCSHFEECGGCKWQNIMYDAQLSFKQKQVEDALQRIGGITPLLVHPIVGSAQNKYYRNRLDFAFSNRKWITRKEGEPLISFEDSFQPGLGFHISGKFDKVLDVEQCFLQPEPSNAIRNFIREFALQRGYTFFDLRRQHGFLRSLIIKTTTTGELMVILVFFENKVEEILRLADAVANEFPQITSLYTVHNPKANDTIFDLEHKLFSGKEYITEKIEKTQYQYGPKSFFQTNPAQAQTLFSLAKKMAQLKGDENVYDLYTGVGSIALYLASSVKKIVGLEYVEEAIEFAQRNAQLNGIENASFLAGDVKKMLDEDFIATHGKPDVLFTDPPRSGMEPAVVKKILEMAPPKIIYISCNPATQARDLALLKENNIITESQAVDMFPHTHHVENIAVLEKK